MKSETVIEVDLARSAYGPWVEAVQGDGGTRCVSVRLMDNKKPWYPSDAVEIALAYAHPNGMKGLYNKLPDGRQAISVNGNTVNAILAPKMLAVPGEVQAALVFNNKKLEQLTTFPFKVTVKENPFTGAQEVEDYIRLQWLEDKLDEYLKKAKDSGEFDGPKGDAFTYSDFTPEQLSALTGPQGPQGDNTVAVEAAAAANAAAKQAIDAAAAAQAVVDTVVSDITQLKQGISDEQTARKTADSALRIDIDAYEQWYPGVDLTVKFADEIARYSDPGAWIRDRIRSANFDGVHVNDYIPFETTNNLNFKARILGIDTYYEYGGTPQEHHIDFICDELWPNPHPINPVKYNNGLIPTENIMSDGSATQYVLTKPMYAVAKVSLSGADLTGWTYNKDTYTITFREAPASGTMTVTGVGSKHPWLASDAYLWLNSLAGHVANDIGANPAIKQVDYTEDGVYHFLPDWLKTVIIEKRFMLNERYSTAGVLSDDNSVSWTTLGKLWFPTELEVYGIPVWGGKSGNSLCAAIQYPYFIGNMRRIKKQNGIRSFWWLLSPSVNATHWCYVNNYGNANYNVASNTNIIAPVCFRVG